MIVAGTGHRPGRCLHSELEVRSLARNKLRGRADAFICGMAAGFDLWAGDEARLLGIEVIAVRPWAGHEPRNADKELYSRVLGHASRVVNVSELLNYEGPWVYQKRNEWMVDNATHVMAYLNPEATGGGTYNCVKYAEKVGKPIANIVLDPPF